MPARLWEVGRKLHEGIRTFFDAPPGPGALPLELLQAALDELERKTEPAGRGRRVFPYTRITIRVTRPDADRAAIEAVFGQLEARLRERLRELRCDPPLELRVGLVFTDAAGSAEPVLRVECDHDGEAPSRAAAGPEPPELRVVVVRGQCEQAAYTFKGGTIGIGRGPEPSDATGRVRRNHVAFTELRDGVNETVARAHARLAFDPGSRAYQVFNESGSNPTFLLRGGRTLRIAPRDPRGVRVQSGDELQLGRAILGLTIGGDE